MFIRFRDRGLAFRVRVRDRVYVLGLGIGFVVRELQFMVMVGLWIR